MLRSAGWRCINLHAVAFSWAWDIHLERRTLQVGVHAPAPLPWLSTNLAPPPSSASQFYSAVTRAVAANPPPFTVFRGCPKPDMSQIHCKTGALWLLPAGWSAPCSAVVVLHAWRTFEGGLGRGLDGAEGIDETAAPLISSPSLPHAPHSPRS